MDANFKKIFLILGISTIGILFLAFGATYICNHYCQYEEASKEFAPALLVFCKFRGFLGANIDAISAFFTAAATIAIGIYTWRLAGVSRSQIDLAEREFIATHRPRIIVTGFDAKMLISKSLEISFICINAGESPASITKKSWGINTGDKPSPRRGGEDVFQAIKLNSGEAHPFTIQIPMRDDTEEAVYALAMFNNGNRRVYFIGSITYEDEGQIQRKTGVCRVYHPATERWLKVDDSDYEYSY